ncbi:MAG: WG repeat-containing protein [Bacteroidota bacterium]
MNRVLAGLALLVVSGCAAGIVTVETEASSAVVPEADREAGDALQRFQAPSGDWGFMDASGRVVIAPAFEDVAPFSEGRAVFRDGDRYGYLDPTGAVVVEAYYTQAESFSEGRGRVAVGHRGGRRYGFVDPAGVEVVATDLPMAIPYGDGKAVARLRAEPLVGFQRLLARMGIGPDDNHFVAVDSGGQVVHDVPKVRGSAPRAPSGGGASVPPTTPSTPPPPTGR